MNTIITENFILSLQAARNLEELWRMFLAEISPRLNLREAFLEYKAGMLSNRMDKNGNTLPLNPSPSDDTEAPGPQFMEQFRCERINDKIILHRRDDNYFCETELLPDLPPLSKKALKDLSDYLTSHARIFLNQVILMLRLENFEFHAVKDDITLAYNQKHLRAYLSTEIERCQRYPSTFSLIFCDLDNLKAVNDKFGHLVGTRVLQDVAEVLRASIRKSDFLSRFGGDEFVIILLKTNAQAALEICSRIKHRLDHTLFLSDRGLNIHMTGSFGISVFPEDGDSVETLIKKADTAMYQIKRTGKNGIKIYQGD